MPRRMCSSPSSAYVRATSNDEGVAANTKVGVDGERRATCTEPSLRAERTSTSVMVAESPLIPMGCPAKPPLQTIDVRSMYAVLDWNAIGSEASVQLSGNRGWIE